MLLQTLGDETRLNLDLQIPQGELLDILDGYDRYFEEKLKGTKSSYHSHATKRWRKLRRPAEAAAAACACPDALAPRRGPPTPLIGAGLPSSSSDGGVAEAVLLRLLFEVHAFEWIITAFLWNS